MASGVPLAEELRWPWLAAVRGWLDSQNELGRRGVVACSALRRAYRDVLAGAHGGAFFVHLDIPEDVLARRLEAREGHFMPPSLLTSQLRLLEPPGPDEHGAIIAGDAEIAEVVNRARGAVPAI